MIPNQLSAVSTNFLFLSQSWSIVWPIFPYRRHTKRIKYILKFIISKQYNLSVENIKNIIARWRTFSKNQFDSSTSNEF